MASTEHEPQKEVKLSPTMERYFKLLDKEREEHLELVGEPINGRRSLELMQQAAEEVGDNEFANKVKQDLASLPTVNSS